MEFIPRKIDIEDGRLATFAGGSGPQIVFLHGGPGDTHHYLRKLAQPLLEEYRCILFDQRGTGDSLLKELSFESLTIEKHIRDLLLLKQSYGISKLTLVGHSWGALLALLTAMQRPEEVEKIILLGMGPLDEEMSRIANANFLQVLLPQERMQWQKLRTDRKEALANGQEEIISLIEEKMMKLRVRAWIYRPELRDGFLQDYFSCPPVNRAINQVVHREGQRSFRWSDLDKVKAKIYLGQGHQDLAPLSQVYRIRERLGNIEFRLWNECGHMPWYDQPDLFYWDLRSFLTGPT